MACTLAANFVRSESNANKSVVQKQALRWRHRKLYRDFVRTTSFAAGRTRIYRRVRKGTHDFFFWKKDLRQNHQMR